MRPIAEYGLLADCQGAALLARDGSVDWSCVLWLAQALARAGAADDASAVFEAAHATANDLGLMAEQFDVRSGGMLGNFPLALSHASLVLAADEVSRVAEAGGPAASTGGARRRVRRRWPQPGASRPRGSR